MKFCIGCQKKLSENNFNKDKSKNDGLYPRCKLCRVVFRVENKEKISKQRRKRYVENKEKILEQSKNSYKKRRNKVIAQKKIYEREKLDTDLIFKLKHRLRDRFRKAIKNDYKSGSAVRDLGCSVDELKQWLESQFYSNSKTGEKMTWDNYGFYGWHIDHIKPLSSFDLTNREQLLKACNYTNLQPLWCEENLSKQ